MPQLATALHVTAGLGFIEGEHCGQGLPQIHFFARSLQEWATEPPAESTAEGDGEGTYEDFGDEGREEPEWHEDRGQRLHAVQRRAEHFTTGSMLSLMLAAKDTAQDLVNTWEAFGTCCRTRLGVTAETMLRAWRFPVAGEFEETLKYYSKLKPDPVKVKEYTRHICINWDRWFNPGRGFDAGGEDGGAVEDEGGEDGE